MSDAASAESIVIESSPDQTAGVFRAEYAPGRSSIEFLAALILGVVVFRLFVAEAYIVPTGSMAPTLMGLHRELTCSNCKKSFAVGMDEQGRSARPLCPNCGSSAIDDALTVDRNGDRLLVQKYLYDLRKPRRWEVAVFQNPGDPSQAYVKRIVGLPGESIRIHEGDVYIDGRIAQKNLVEQRATRQLVFDNDYVPADSDRYPRWTFRSGNRGGVQGPSGWRAEDSRFFREPEVSAADRIDWLEYRHWDPERAAYGPVRDFCGYNGGEARRINRVNDLMVEADVAVGPGIESLSIRFRTHGDWLTVTLPTDPATPCEVRRAGRIVWTSGSRTKVLPVSAVASWRSVRLEASVIDRCLTLAIDGSPIFPPLDLSEMSSAGDFGASASPIALGVLGEGAARISGLKIYRDVYYTDDISGGARRPFAVDEPYELGPGEYFVLGDNSPVSNDSRFWPKSPVVPEALLVGKPFLVHLPSRGMPLKVFGGETYWVPDPREIRYID